MYNLRLLHFKRNVLVLVITTTNKTSEEKTPATPTRSSKVLKQESLKYVLLKYCHFCNYKIMLAHI